MAHAAEATFKADDRTWPHLVDDMTPADDGLGGDFSGARAHAHLEMHMRECERNRQEDRQLQAERQAEIRGQLSALHARLDALADSFDHRLNAISNRMWAAAVGIILILLGAVGYLWDHPHHL